jgi:hypothetical protein
MDQSALLQRLTRISEENPTLIEHARCQVFTPPTVTAPRGQEGTRRSRSPSSCGLAHTVCWRNRWRARRSEPAFHLQIAVRHASS